MHVHCFGLSIPYLFSVDVSWRWTNHITTGGISIQASSGDRPVLRSGSVGMVSAYVHSLNTSVARASKMIVITTPTRIKMPTCHLWGWWNHWRDLDIAATAQKAKSEIPTSPTVANEQFLTTSAQECPNGSWKKGICWISQKKYSRKENRAMFHSGLLNHLNGRVEALYLGIVLSMESDCFVMDR